MSLERRNIDRAPTSTEKYGIEGKLYYDSGLRSMFTRY